MKQEGAPYANANGWSGKDVGIDLVAKLRDHQGSRLFSASSTIRSITITNTHEEAYDYVVNGKPAIE